MFRMNGIPRAQDAQERYLSSWHCMYRRTRRSGISQAGTACIAGRAGVVSLKLALHVSQDAQERYLSSWHCMYRRARRSGVSQPDTLQNVVNCQQPRNQTAGQYLESADSCSAGSFIHQAELGPAGINAHPRFAFDKVDISGFHIDRDRVLRDYL